MATSSTISHLLSAILPPEIASFINQHALQHDSAFQTVQRNLTDRLSTLLSSIAPIVQPLLDRFISLLYDNQGVSGLIALVLTFIAALMVLQFVQRVIMWWARMTMRVVFWGALVLLGSWVYQRGAYATFKDLVVVGSRVGGYLAVLKDVWLEEYDRYSEGQNKGRVGGGGSGVGQRGRGKGRSGWR